MKNSLTIGVLALQGDFDAHRRRLEELGARAVLIKHPQQLNEVDALIVPGGESSTFLNLLRDGGFLDALREFVQAKPTFGTCAGAILLAREVMNPPQPSLGAMDVAVRRNAYGRQLESFIHSGETMLGAGPLEMVFIRAPRIERAGPGVEVLARVNGDPVLVRQGHLLAATFHPELSADRRVHEFFLQMAGRSS